jgi:putative peptidoglycan lipid II flippase
MNNIIKNILRNPVVVNILTVGVITLIVKVFGFYKEMLVASSFGLSELLDTFLIAILIPSFIQNVFISALKNIFIPNYIIEQNSGGNINQFQSVIFLITLSISFFFYLLIYLSSDFFLIKIFPGHSLEYYELIKNQLYYVLPCLFIWGINSILSGLLEIENKYFLATISGVFGPIIMIICLFVFKDIFGNMVLAIGTLLGAIFTLIYMIFVSIKNNILCLRKPKINANSLMMLKQLPPKISSGLLSSMNEFVDQFFAAQLVVGSIAAINYGIKVPSLIVSIVIMAMGNVLLNYILIEQFEIYGLVIATVIINISGFVFYTIYTHKQFRHATINFN